MLNHLPYLDHLENPDGVVDNIALQMYLLVTGLLTDNIENNLDMIVTDGKFNNAGIRRALHTKYRTIIKKPNPINVVFKDKAISLIHRIR